MWMRQEKAACFHFEMRGGSSVRVRYAGGGSWKKEQFHHDGREGVTTGQGTAPTKIFVPVWNSGDRTGANGRGSPCVGAILAPTQAECLVFAGIRAAVADAADLIGVMVLV